MVHSTGMRHVTSAHIGQFARYIFSGTFANIVDIGGFWVILQFNAHYIVATLVSGTAGFLSAFFLHKYYVFGKAANHMQHFIRFAVLGAFNIFAVTAVLWICVEYIGTPEVAGKVIANASQVLWGFFLMKFFVYV